MIHPSMRTAAAGAAASLLSQLVLVGAAVGPAAAQVVAAAGYIFSSTVVSDTTQSCVAAGPGCWFVGIGAGFTGQGQAVVRITPAGGEQVVVDGLNSIGDCAYDASTDTLYVSDNGLEAVGAVTGDTVFAVPSASVATDLAAPGLELVPPGTISSAASVAVDAAGAVYVGDSVGSGAGSVFKIPGGVTPPFIENAFDFTGGIAVDAAGDVYVAESLTSFENQISRFDATGTFQEFVSGPTFSYGSFDLAFLADGLLLISGAFGGDVVALDVGDASLAAFASGLTFATGIAVNGFTGRADLLSSTFLFPDPPDEDFSVHSFTPVDRLVAGKGSAKTSCVSELYGVELVAGKAGKPAKQAICSDGAACDADGRENGSCLFQIGFCLDVDDPTLPDCASAGVAAFELKKTKPDSAALQTTAAAIQAALPVSGPTCFFSDGIRVDLKTTGSGRLKAGKGLVKTKAASGDTKALKDTDTLKLVCQPAASG